LRIPKKARITPRIIAINGNNSWTAVDVANIIDSTMSLDKFIITLSYYLLPVDFISPTMKRIPINANTTPPTTATTGSKLVIVSLVAVPTDAKSVFPVSKNSIGYILFLG
jgi:hypothetical protein